MSEPTNFTDPYESIPRKDKSRTTIDVSMELRSEFNAIYTKKGVLQTTINILLEKLRNEFKRHGIQSYSPDEYKYGVANCTISLGGFDGAATTTDDPRIPRIPARKRTKQPKPSPSIQVNP